MNKYISDDIIKYIIEPYLDDKYIKIMNRVIYYLDLKKMARLHWFINRKTLCPFINEDSVFSYIDDPTLYTNDDGSIHIVYNPKPDRVKLLKPMAYLRRGGVRANGIRTFRGACICMPTYYRSEKYKYWGNKTVLHERINRDFIHDIINLTK